MNSPVLHTRLDETAAETPAATARSGLSGRAVLIGVLLLAALGTVHLMNPQTLPIRHVRVKGDFQHLSLAGLQQRASKVVSGGFFNVNVDTIRRVLLQDPWIGEVTVKRVWPDSINVYIREQKAVARWNDTALLNADGKVFRPDPSTLPDGIPQFRGPPGTDRTMLDFYHKLRALLPGDMRVAALTLSKRRAWQVRFAGGPLLRLGRTDIMQRLRRFAAYVPTQLHDRLDLMRTVDMRYTNGFAVQWKPHSKPDL